jgi:hypothetical protein
MSEIKLTEIERRIIERQRRYGNAWTSTGGVIDIMDTYIRELEAKAGNSECDEKLRESLAKEAMLRAEAEKARDMLEADLACSKHEVALLTEELRKAKDRAEAAHLTDQQMMEWAVARILDYTGKTNYCVQFHVGGTMNVPPHGIRLNVVEVAAAILSGTKGDA